MLKPNLYTHAIKVALCNSPTESAIVWLYQLDNRQHETFGAGHYPIKTRMALRHFAITAGFSITINQFNSHQYVD